MTEYWSIELAKVVKRVRQDFEAFYSTVYREMSSYYESKAVEMEAIVKRESQEQEQYVGIEELSMNYQKLQIEYEKVQKTYTYEHEIFLKLEASYSK
jgi:hypothetical protein